MTAVFTAEQERRLAVLRDRPAGMLLIHEIYASVQGESTFAGLPCSFVRLTGCPYRCRWCDTPHSFTEGQPMTIAAVVAAVAALSPSLVEMTGGEPLAQSEALGLLSALADTGKTVLLETSGALPIDDVDSRVVTILDIKCPSSDEEPSNRYENLAILRPRDEVKFVIGDRADFDWSVAIVQRYGLLNHAVLFSPVFGELSYAELCRWILATGLPIRFQMQQHKHIWDPKARGV